MLLVVICFTDSNNIAVEFWNLWFACHVYRGQESEEKLVSEGVTTTWAEQADAEEKAAAAERQVYFCSSYKS